MPALGRSPRVDFFRVAVAPSRSWCPPELPLPPGWGSGLDVVLQDLMCTAHHSWWAIQMITWLRLKGVHARPPQVRILSSTHFPACSEQLNLNLDICVNLCQLRQLCKWAMCRQLSPRSHCSLALTTSHFSRWCHSKIISVGVPQSLPTSAASTPKLGKFLIWTSRLRWICTLSSCCCLTCSRNKDSTVFPLWVLLGHDRVF